MVSMNGKFRQMICESNLATPTMKLKVRDSLMCKQRCYIYLLRYVAPQNSGNRGLYWRWSLCLEDSSRNVLLVRENRINPVSINVTGVAIGCLPVSVPGQRHFRVFRCIRVSVFKTGVRLNGL